MKSIVTKILLLILIITCVYFLYGYLFDKTDKYIHNLQSKNVMVQSEAIYYLGNLGEKSAVPILCKFLKRDTPKKIKLQAIQALGEIGEGSAVTPLFEVLGEKDSELRIAAVEALGKIKDPKAIPHLINVLDDTDVQVVAIWALGNIGDSGASAALTNLLGDENKYIRYNASQSLKKIGNGN